MIRIEYTDSTWKFPFVLYAPENMEDNLPLILQLHGAGERGNGKEELYYVDVHGFSNILSEDTEHRCLVVMPQCPKTSFWAAHVESILEFIEQLKAHFSIDEDRLYLTGMSMGGFGTWFTAMAKPGLFAAIAPICGGGMAWNAAVLTMPIRTFHGVDDPIVSVHQTDEMVEALQNCGADVQYTRLEGVGHEVWDKTYDVELLEWLLNKRRK